MTHDEWRAFVLEDTRSAKVAATRAEAGIAD
jgi:hypothetical protein